MKVFIDISPKEDESYCQNCRHFMKWGCHTGVCLLSKRMTDKQDWDKCKMFDKDSIRRIAEELIKQKP